MESPCKNSARKDNGDFGAEPPWLLFCFHVFLGRWMCKSFSQKKIFSVEILPTVFIIVYKINTSEHSQDGLLIFYKIKIYIFYLRFFNSFNFGKKKIETKTGINWKQQLYF